MCVLLHRCGIAHTASCPAGPQARGLPVTRKGYRDIGEATAQARPMRVGGGLCAHDVLFISSACPQLF